MSEDQVARVYARALFDAASVADTVAATGADLRAFAQALADAAPLADVMFNPQVDTAAKRRVLGELTREGDGLAVNTLGLLLDKGRIAVVPAVADEFDHLAATAARVVELELTTAVPVEPELEQRIVARVESATGRSARVKRSIDPGIIGGLVLRVGDVIIDGSVSSHIRQLRKRLELADVRGGE